MEKQENANVKPVLLLYILGDVQQLFAASQ